MVTMQRLLSVLCLLLLFPILSFGQESVLRLDNYFTSGLFLNQQLIADTVLGGVPPANRVYELERGGIYLANASFRVNPGGTVRMRANDSAGVSRPVIFLWPRGGTTTPTLPPGNLFDMRGTLLDLKDLVISGYFEPIDTNLYNLQGVLIDVPAAGAGANIRIESCILTNSNGNHVRTTGATGVISVRNSIFANMGYLGTSNLGAGKAIDLRDASQDSVIFVNNTFVNWQDRIIRHYSIPTPTLTGPTRFLKFEHNTLVNGMSYHGLLSLGTVGPRAIITNNLLIDPFSLGNDTDATRQSEFLSSLETDPYGGARMNWIFSTPNDITQWTISNNYYAISDSGQAFYDEFASAGVTGEGSPLTWHLNSKLGADSVNAFTKISIALNKIPAVMLNENRWYRSPTGGNKIKNTPACGCWTGAYDYDRRGWKWYDDTLDCAYSTGSPAYTGAQGGYPVGDLNWFPDRYTQWLNDPISDVSDQLVGLPNTFSLDQNYPNPFNPATTIAYSVPKTTRVRLEVFDLLGRSVGTLVDETKEAGNQSIVFDATHLASGVYFYRLTAAEFVLSHKMVLMK